VFLVAGDLLTSSNMSDDNQVKCYKFKVKGMHCASCELLLESKLSSLPGVRKVDAKLGSNMIEIHTTSSSSAEELASAISKVVEKDGYLIDQQLYKTNQFDEWFYSVPLSVFFILVYAVVVRAGLFQSDVTNLDERLQVFVLGIGASLSSCMALVGGIVFSISSALDGQPPGKRYLYHASFHLGRLIGFFFLGGLIGVVGSVLKPSAGFSVVLNLLVVFVFLILGISQIFPQSFSKFQFRLPKLFGRLVVKLKVSSPQSSFLIGALTFFIPCGFTNSIQIKALESGSFLSSAIIMFTFALGTLPVLAMISFASTNLSERFNNGIFKKTIGILILALAFYNLILVLNRI